jgi:hypothetical protein
MPSRNNENSAPLKPIRRVRGMLREAHTSRRFTAVEQEIRNEQSSITAFKQEGETLTSWEMGYKATMLPHHPLKFHCHKTDMFVSNELLQPANSVNMSAILSSNNKHFENQASKLSLQKILRSSFLKSVLNFNTITNHLKDFLFTM